jgi:hypothetical protein
MLTPVLVQVIFWISVILCLGIGLFDMIKGQWLTGLQIFFLGPFVVRVIAEFFIIFFRMNDTLTDIKNSGSKTKKI